MKYIPRFIVLFVLVFTLLIAPTFAGFEGGGSYDYTGSNGNEDQNGDGASCCGGDDGEDLVDLCAAFGICTQLTIDTGIFCWVEDRSSPNVRRVYHNTETYFGFQQGGDDTKTYEGKTIKKMVEEIFSDDGGAEEHYLSKPFIKEAWGGTPPKSSAPWITKKDTDDVRLYRYEGSGKSSDSEFGSGAGCRAYGGFFVGYNPSEGWEDGSHFYERAGMDQNFKYFDSGNFSAYSTPGGWKSSWNDRGAELNVVWDKPDDNTNVEDGFDCTTLGGAWTEENGYNDGGNNYYCCGDDYIWVNNRPLTEEERESSYQSMSSYSKLKEDESDPATKQEIAVNYCLYSFQDEEHPDGGTTEELREDVISTDDEGTYYTCEATEFRSYDNALKIVGENCYDEDNSLLPTCTFLHAESNGEKTDLGKWSSNTGENPQVCYIAKPLEETEGVPQFVWDEVNDAGNLAMDIEGNEIENFKDDHTQTICESYLGGIWTGSSCCGNKYDYGDWGYDGYFAESFSDPIGILYNYKTEESGNIYNYACIQGEAIKDVDARVVVPVSGPTGWYETEGIKIELLNVDGNLYGCNIPQLEADGSTLGDDFYTENDLITKDHQVDACTVVEGTNYLCSYYPDGEEDEYGWQWLDITSGTEGSYVSNTLGYTTGDKFASSDASAWADLDGDGEADEGYASLQACCAGNSCWDGNECLDEYSIYRYGNDDDKDGVGDDAAICASGSWKTNVDPKYDWYYNTDTEAIDYCAYDYACVCSSNTEDDTFCTENEDYIAGGCTTEEDFYKNDHLCEATGTDSNNDTILDTIDGAHWTSRTKILAFHLLEIANNVGTDFTLFCDSYENAVNNYEQISDVDNINNVCILQQDGQTIFAVTLNWEDDTLPTYISEEALADILEGGSDSLLDDALNSDVTDCSSTLGKTLNYRFGDFYACDTSSKTTWYNDEINALIYAKDGINSAAYTGSLLYYPGEKTKTDWQQEFDDHHTMLWDTYLSSGNYDILTPDEVTDLYGSRYFDGFEHIQDYNTIYYRYDTSSGTTQEIFGFEELKYSQFGDETRYFMGVIYDGYDLDCEQVYAPYSSQWAINCGEDIKLQSGVFDIVLERNPVRSDHWNDLTAAIRSAD
jgi:hypothetical protein